MAAVGRNQPCACGSGRKAKRCCGVRHGPAPEQLARAQLVRLGQQAALLLTHLDDQEFTRAFDRMLRLPDRDLTLVAPLPRLWGPVWEQLAAAIQRDDVDGIDDALPAVLAQADTPELRLGLAEAAVRLGDQGQVDREVAAMAVVDLSGRSSALVASSVVTAVAVKIGATATPAGLVVARA